MINFDALGHLAIGQYSPNAAVFLGAATGVFAETGLSSGFVVTIPAPTTAYVIAASAALLSSKMTSSAGAYTETANAALLNTRFVSTAGAYAFTGLPATFSGSGAALGAGSYVITSNAAPLLVGLTGATSGLSVSGRDADLSRDFVNWVWDSVPSSAWNSNAVPSSAWSPSSTPSTTWTVDPAELIPPPEVK